MSKKTLSLAFGLLVACISLSNTGCVRITHGNSLGILAIPIPVSPYFQKMQEDASGRTSVTTTFRSWIRSRLVVRARPWTNRVTTRSCGPSSGPIRCRAALPLLHEIQRNNVRIVKEKIADYVDPPRVYPLIGPAQLHHATTNARFTTPR
jgi:hypothetical protein